MDCCVLDVGASQSVVSDGPNAELRMTQATGSISPERGDLNGPGRISCWEYFMRVKHTWLTLAMLVLFSATTASAQTAGTARPDLGNLLTPGMTVWITDSSGQEQRVRIVGVSGDAVTTSADGVSRRLTTNDIRRVEVRQSDSC